MKHILNISKILLYFFIEILAISVSPIIVGIALLLNRIEDKTDCLNSTSNDSTKFKDKWIDAIWGNDDDGLDGDIYYLTRQVDYKRNFFTRFNWVVFKNPVHNLGLKIGFNGFIVSIKQFMIPLNNSNIPKVNLTLNNLIKAHKCNYLNRLKNIKDSQGFEYIVVNNDYPSYRLILKYPLINYGIRINIGWKNWTIGQKCNVRYNYTLSFLINPFTKFK